MASSDVQIGDTEPAPQSSGATGLTTWALLFAAIAVGAVLRFHRIGEKSLWLDEVTTEGFTKLTWPEFLRTMWWGDGNMAFYYALLKGWAGFGDSEFWLRSLSALFGIGSIAAAYFLGKRFLSREAGLFAAFLLSIHSFQIEYSQEVRSYSFLTLLLLLCTYVFLLAIEEPRRNPLWLLYVFLCTLAIYTQVFAVFVLAAEWLVLLSNDRMHRIRFSKIVWVLGSIGILAAPLALALKHNNAQVDTWKHFNRSPGLSDVSELLQRIAGAKAGDVPTSAASVALLALYISVWAVAMLTIFRSGQGHAARPNTSNLTIWMLAAWLALPVVVMFLLSLKLPMYSPRYLLMCVPAAVLLAGHGLSTMRQIVAGKRFPSLLAFALMIALALSSTLTYYSSFQVYGNDWRSVTDYLLSSGTSRDGIIFYTLTGHREFDYYTKRRIGDVNRASEPVPLFPIVLDTAGIQKRTAPYQRVWLVLHQNILTPQTDTQSQQIRAALETRFRLVAQREFLGRGVAPGESGTITVTLYTRQK
jgi:mannosyltransferase